MGELVRFPYSERMKAIEANMPLVDRVLLRQFVEDSVLFRLENVVDMEDAREEIQHRRLV